jgi:hypothetical protein
LTAPGKWPAANLGRHRLHAVLDGQIILDQALHLREVVLGHLPQHVQQPDHLVARQAIEDMLAVLTRADQPGMPELLQVLGGICDAQPRDLGQRLHAALALGEEFQQLQAVGTAQGLPDPGELGEEGVFEVA